MPSKEELFVKRPAKHLALLKQILNAKKPFFRLA
jgi:hypothetical protein